MARAMILTGAAVSSQSGAAREILSPLRWTPSLSGALGVVQIVREPLDTDDATRARSLTGHQKRIRSKRLDRADERFTEES